MANTSLAPSTPLWNRSMATSEVPRSGFLVSDWVSYLIKTINYAVMCNIIDLFGTVTNGINIAAFIKLGSSDSVNISLLGLAISDMGCLVTLHWHSISYVPFFLALDLPFDQYDTQHATAGMPHVFFSRITASITAFITLERCLCVSMPLKVKSIINPKRAKIIISCCFLLQGIAAIPTYYSTRLGPKWFPKKNKTLIGLVFTEDRFEVERVAFAIFHVFVPLCAFVIVTTSTLVIVVKLKEKTKWRSKATGQATDNLTNRDQQVAKMVVMISIMFIVCYAPVTIVFIAMAIVPDFSINGRYQNIYNTSFSFGFVLEAINSSMNIFIYYRMSSKYREVFDTMFCRKKKNDVSSS